MSSTNNEAAAALDSTHVPDTTGGTDLAATLVRQRETAAREPGGERLQVGAVRYEPGRELGRGGMGRVVDALDLQFQRRVAVKELLADPRDTGLVVRFEREALVTGNLEHPGIPSVYERGVDGRGVPFYAMRKVQGRTLAEALDRARSLEERLALLPNLIKAAQTVGYAHARGVVHRDIKPANIVLGDHGDTVVLDWGIAKVKGVPVTDEGSAAVPGKAQETSYGAVLGTPGYMAPEQASGANDQVDERSDVFALGATLYHLLGGRKPYSGSSAEEVLTLAKRGQMARLDDLVPSAPKGLRDICGKAMAVEPTQRYASAGELAKALEDFLSDAVTGTPSRAWRWVTNTLTAFPLVVLIASSVAIWRLTDFRELGFTAWFIVALSLTGVSLGVIEWVTRGRHHLESVVLSLAGATFLAGLVGTVIGMSQVFAYLRKIAGDATEFRQVLAQGSREAMGNLSMGSVFAALLLVLWGVAKRGGRGDAARKRRRAG